MSQANISLIYGSSDIAPIVTSVEWSGHSEKPNRQLTVSLKNTRDGRTPIFKFSEGERLIFKNNGVQLFIGIIFSVDINEVGDTNLTAYDENIYLLKSVESRRFKSLKASEIAKRLCNDFGVPIGNIADTGYVIPKVTLREKSLYDMIISTLTLTRKQTGKRFFIGCNNGKFTLTNFGTQQTQYIIEAGNSILNAQYTTSIEETKTQVKVIGGKDDAYVSTAKDAALVKKYGVMQEVEYMDEEATKSQVEQRAKQLLKERAVIDDQAVITALGLDEITTGTAVYVREPMTGIVGGFYVTSDSHTYTNGIHTMTLELSATYELPALELSEEELK